MSGSGTHILLVEDEVIVARDLQARLGRLGYGRIDVAHDGEGALALFEEGPPDLVLMDIRLRGDVDGIETARRLHERASVPLVYLTAYADPETLERAKHTRPAGYVLKPFDERDLHGTIEMALWKHKADEALRRSEAGFRMLIERTPDAIAVHRDGRFLYVNRAALEVLGYERSEELVGRSIYELFSPGVGAAVAEHLARLAVEKHDAAPVETRMLHRDGSVRVAEISTFTLEFDGLPAFVAIGRDLTERRRMEAQLALADRMASVGTLAAGVAHEISNPLTYALHNLDRLAEDLPRLGEALRTLVPGGSGIDAGLLGHVDGLADRVRRAVDGCVRVREIVRDLKTFSRFDDDAPMPMSVNGALEAALSMAHNELKYRAQIVSELGATPPVLATEGRLSQVFLNLLVNAAHAIPEGHVADNEVRVRSFAEGEEVVVEVRDTGEGISPENQRRLFDPFFTTKPAGVGSGLGLSICHNIVSAYGGRVEVESRVGEGSMFRVRLPAARAGAAPAGGPRRRPTPPPVPGRILIVDDETNICVTLRSLLAPTHEVKLALSGAEARERLEADDGFDVILCDLMMPDVSGMDLHAWLEERDPDLAGRMVFMTGGAFTQRARAFLDASAGTCLEKPFKLDRLSKAITEVITARGRRNRTQST